MKILHVTPSYFPAVRYGGPIYSVHGLAMAQAAKGDSVSVYTTSIDGPYDLNVPLDHSVQMDGVELHYCRPGLGRRLFRSPDMATLLRTNIRKFDVVHIHSVFLWPTLTAARLANRSRVPYILSPRGMLWPELIEERSKWMKKIWIALFERTTVEQAEAVHVTAEIEAEKISELGLTARQFITLSNGISEPEDYNEEDVSADVFNAVDPTQPYLLSLGRMNWKKNLTELIMACENCPRIQLILAGQSEDDYASKMHKIIAQSKLEHRVKIIDRQVQGADKEFLFEKSLGFILPSLSENFGNTVLEAMIRRKPVIVSAQAGAAEVVKRVDCGLVCEPDRHSLAEKINVFQQDETARETWAMRGYQSAVEQYSWSSIAAKMSRIYERIL